MLGFLSHLHSLMVTMSQKSSIPQAAKSVSQVLKSDTTGCPYWLPSLASRSGYDVRPMLRCSCSSTLRADRLANGHAPHDLQLPPVTAVWCSGCGTAHVRARYSNVSHMWIARRLADDPNFPHPIYIAKPRFWRIGDLINWKRGLATQIRGAVS